MELSMYKTMLQLPLFQGLVHNDLTHIIETVKLGFDKHKAGEVIARAHHTCDRLTFLLKGELSVRTSFPDVPCHLTEFIQAPFVIEPQSLFGMDTSFVSTYTARTEADTLSVSKASVLDELFRYDIFRLNYTNLVCNRAQTLRNRLWALPHGTLRQRIALFILLHCERPAGKKILKIKMAELATALHDNRFRISKALHDMEQAGLLTHTRGVITVHDAHSLQ